MRGIFALDAASATARPDVFALSIALSVIESAPLRFCALRLCARDLDREALARFARLPFELLRLEFELDRFALLLGLEPVAFRRVSVRLFELFVLVDCAISLLGFLVQSAALRAACLLP
jgi:hypothetical protein